MLHCLAATVLVATLPASSMATATATLVDTTIFKAGEGGYDTYRIPAIVQTLQANVLLAFAEGRKLSSSDHGWNDIMQKRSTDNGRSWENLTVVHGESSPGKLVTIGNPAPILDSTTGRLFMLYSRDNAQVGVLHSDDEGISWSGVTNLTDALMVKNNWTTIFTGLSAGFTLAVPSAGSHAGAAANSSCAAAKSRLLVCSNHNGPASPGGSIGRNAGRYSSTIYSDDGGETWLAGTDVGPAGSTECNVGSTTRGGVFMYSRLWNQGAGKPTFGIAQSNDGGVTFPKGFSNAGMDWPQPDCEGTMRVGTSTASSSSYSSSSSPSSSSSLSGAGEPCFMLSAPYGKGRANMTLSHTCGDVPGTWVHDRVLWQGPAAYSAMDTSLDGSTLFVAYERGTKSPYEEIHLNVVPVTKLA